MKKLFALIACVALCFLALTGCAEDPIGAFKENYEDQLEPDKELLSLNLYMICEEGTVKTAYDTVQQRIESYTLATYGTALKVVYCSASEYDSIIRSAAKSTVSAKRADIFVINTPELYNYLANNKIVANLSEYINSKEFGTLNKGISDALMEAVTIHGEKEFNVLDKTGNVILDENGNPKTELRPYDYIYAIPNNRVVGEYEYLLINRSEARKCQYSDNDLSKMTTLESVADLKAKMEAAGVDSDDYIKVVNGLYGDRFTYENEGYACNVLSVPQIDRDYAVSGSLAISTNTKDTQRAMEMLYAINTDVTLHNYLLYGIAPTNFALDEETEVATREKEGNSVYLINPLYTGDLFKSYFCEEFGWTKDMQQYAIIQNNEAVFIDPTVEE